MKNKCKVIADCRAGYMVIAFMSTTAVTVFFGLKIAQIQTHTHTQASSI